MRTVTDRIDGSKRDILGLGTGVGVGVMVGVVQAYRLACRLA